ncbi:MULTISPECIES: YicC/YloC family endoribonuclease [Bacillaceae]|uniref:YicC/YloC family endoribonuclease n=1 Tax=Bacillaceae TaxID=186817 RepID=UPI001C586963|nr:YicC/YloC family endoribonuclease [Rossellomorea sp. YZS02]MBW3113929.1 YicC family protein [Bacillus sp. MCCB 382]MDX8343040.1 YicC/YloC family endoribonuclease [Rossellomorea sp. YZS02]
MVVSMTGFGRSKVESEQHSVTVEMKSVNHRFSECYIRMPRQLLKLEDKIKKQVSQSVKRGKVDIFITISGEGLVHKNLHIDWKLIQDYYQLVNKVKKTFSLHDEVQLSHLLDREEFVMVEEMEEENEELEHLVLKAVDEAVLDLRRMREKEGELLKNDFLTHLQKFELSVGELTQHAPEVVNLYRERLRKRIVEYNENSFDESRILTEVAIFADKSDITEELTRLKSHIQYFHSTLMNEGPVGRKLDFMIQEMNREVNTIGSKANDSFIATIVVELKSTLEKLREQVQNVE